MVLFIPVVGMSRCQDKEREHHSDWKLKRFGAAASQQRRKTKKKLLFQKSTKQRTGRHSRLKGNFKIIFILVAGYNNNMAEQQQVLCVLGPTVVPITVAVDCECEGCGVCGRDVKVALCLKLQEDAALLLAAYGLPLGAVFRSE